MIRLNIHTDFCRHGAQDKYRQEFLVDTMSKSRIEAFSDDVMASIITIKVLGPMALLGSE